MLAWDFEMSLEGFFLLLASVDGDFRGFVLFLGEQIILERHYVLFVVVYDVDELLFHFQVMLGGLSFTKKPIFFIF